MRTFFMATFLTLSVVLLETQTASVSGFRDTNSGGLRLLKSPIQKRQSSKQINLANGKKSVVRERVPRETFTEENSAHKKTVDREARHVVHVKQVEPTDATGDQVFTEREVRNTEHSVDKQVNEQPNTKEREVRGIPAPDDEEGSGGEQEKHLTEELDNLDAERGESNGRGQEAKVEEQDNVDREARNVNLAAIDVAAPEEENLNIEEQEVQNENAKEVEEQVEENGEQIMVEREARGDNLGLIDIAAPTEIESSKTARNAKQEANEDSQEQNAEEREARHADLSAINIAEPIQEQGTEEKIQEQQAEEIENQDVIQEEAKGAEKGSDIEPLVEEIGEQIVGEVEDREGDLAAIGVAAPNEEDGLKIEKLQIDDAAEREARDAEQETNAKEDIAGEGKVRAVDLEEIGEAAPTRVEADFDVDQHEEQEEQREARHIDHENNAEEQAAENEEEIAGEIAIAAPPSIQADSDGDQQQEQVGESQNEDIEQRETRGTAQENNFEANEEQIVEEMELGNAALDSDDEQKEVLAGESKNEDNEQREARNAEQENNIEEQAAGNEEQIVGELLI